MDLTLHDSLGIHCRISHIVQHLFFSLRVVKNIFLFSILPKMQLLNYTINFVYIDQMQKLRRQFGATRDFSKGN
ncbi:hypothetical protein EGR_04625 [Echinococcus granulosus]|uniref:Uncharacterized protein n=1 Tax=Echinococcus granulosus TaxID=6210 RepID=W6UH96_ECHGR|nr:hypothetical protein EGR_04625 [Echinococcus granulosus]EUB60431.1 hypothetical protein EGR_04625 [Echinococcus granulosus]